MRKVTLTSNLFVMTLLTSVLVTMAAANVHAGTKVQICHIPPGSPENFHTITVSENAVRAHLAHGDLFGSCFENCEDLCGDGDACTQDCDPHTEACLPDHPPVDCDDGDPCTLNSCDPAIGCLSAPIDCDDGDVCTFDLCDGGSCLHPPIFCGEFELCAPDLGCYDPCDPNPCDPIDQCHEVGTCSFPGDCQPGNPLPDGTPCNDGIPDTESACEGGECKALCPCFVDPEVDLENYFLSDADLQCGYQTPGRIDIRDLNYSSQSDYQLGAGVVLSSGVFFCEAHNQSQEVYKGLAPLLEAEAMECYNAIQRLADDLGLTCCAPPFPCPE